MECVIEIVAGKIEIRARMIAAARQTVAEKGVGQGEGLGQPLSCIGFAHGSGQFFGVVRRIIIQRPRVPAFVKINDFDGDGGTLIAIHPGVVDIEIHVDVARFSIGAAGVSPLFGRGDMPFRHGFATGDLIILSQPEGKIAAGGIEIEFSFTQRHPYRICRIHLGSQVVLGEFEIGRSSGIGHQTFGKNEVIGVSRQARVDAPHGNAGALFKRGLGIDAFLAVVALPTDGHFGPQRVDGIPNARFVVRFVRIIHQGEIHIWREPVVFDADPQ